MLSCTSPNSLERSAHLESVADDRKQFVTFVGDLSTFLAR